MRRTRTLWLVVVAALVVLGSATLAAPRVFADDLEAAEQRWVAQDLANYRYTLQVSCFCPPPMTRPIVLEVRRGLPVKAIYADSGEAAALTDIERYATIPRLFALIRNAQAQNAYSIHVSYDQLRGYPSQLAIDYIELAVDDELSLRVSDLTPLTDGTGIGTTSGARIHLPVMLMLGRR